MLTIPDEYEILFLQGGASLQFTMIPLNLEKHNVDLINTGQWTKKALKEHEKLGKVNVVASSAEDNFTYIPKIKQEDLSEDSDYVYICENNTMGPAGLTVVIIKKDLIGLADEKTPSMLNYKTYADNDSMFNTPPTYAIYICGLVLEWLETQIGGLESMEKINRQKAKLLYDYIDASKLYSNPVVPEDRSYTNVPFVTGDKDLDTKFVKEAKEAGIVNIKGHRTVGGMRASIYNAMPLEGVEALIAFMKKFEEENYNA